MWKLLELHRLTTVYASLLIYKPIKTPPMHEGFAHHTQNQNHFLTMASSKTSTPSLFAITTLLLFILLSLLSYAKASETHHKKTSSYEFLEHLKGCHKGDKVQGIQDLKKYLEKFGYLNGNTNNDDHFDDELESAIKTYQINYHLKVTGTLDAKTVKKMEMPRCGVPDIINGTTSMRTGKKRGGHGSTHTVGHYAFFQGNPKWPANKYHLTYGFLQGTQSEAVGAVARAFATWQSNTHFTFSQAQSFESADLKIGFGRGDHGDGANNAFDGPGKTIAHAFRPTNGRFHYDADETWVVGAVPGGFDLETVALHEIGHLLGLDHSSVPGAVMQSQIPPGYTQSLHADDVQGIRALYNT
ncbi:metalloendoproteinase 1 [Prunus persica]|nr:metalloendoproteinase 1 [Prunus persica]